MKEENLACVLENYLRLEEKCGQGVLSLSLVKTTLAFSTTRRTRHLEILSQHPLFLHNRSVNYTMASSSSQRMIHQDYIARIRYSNALPPPPNPPKLLDIPNTGLASGQYTTPGFASRLARDQPLNIEADAELGMPLDLVGMPGIFDGDESCK